MSKRTAGYTIIRGIGSYLVRGTCWPDGRKHTELVPGTSGQDAEGRFRRLHPARDGYTFQTRKVADYWRESPE